MVIPELAAIEFSDVDLKGLAIATALANQARVAQQQKPLSDAAYLSARIVDLVHGYAVQHVTQAEDAILLEALKVAQPADREAVAATLKVDLTIPIPSLEDAAAVAVKA